MFLVCLFMIIEKNGNESIKQSNNIQIKTKQKKSYIYCSELSITIYLDQMILKRKERNVLCI